MYKLNKKAKGVLKWAREKGITNAREKEIVRIVLQQEIVSYCTSAGCVTFDYNDLVEAE